MFKLGFGVSEDVENILKKHAPCIIRICFMCDFIRYITPRRLNESRQQIINAVLW